MSPIEDSSKKHKASSSKPKSGSKSTLSFRDFKFVNLNLTSAQKEQVKAIDPDSIAIDDFVESLLDSGHKLSIKNEAKSGAYLATISGVDEACPNYGLIMTARAPSFTKSLLVLFFKCEIVLDGLSWPDASAPTDLWS